MKFAFVFLSKVPFFLNLGGTKPTQLRFYRVTKLKAAVRGLLLFLGLC